MASQKRLNAISTINVHGPGNNDFFFTMVNVIALKTRLYTYFLTLYKYLGRNDLPSEALILNKPERNLLLVLTNAPMINKNITNYH